MDFCKYVNVFQGNGEIELHKPKGIAAKWFFIKAGCGNTNPAACLPFGAMSVGPFSGGYPTGYGDNLVNTHSRPAHFEDGKKLIGFSHLHQSGTGAIGYYYNYAVVTPLYDSSDYRRIPKNEYGEPGYYSCFLDDIKCELTANSNTAFHRYTFSKDGGKAVIDFSNNGLILPDSPKKSVNYLSVFKKGKDICAITEIEGITVYFAVKCNGKSIVRNNKVFIYPVDNVISLSLSISTVNTNKAKKNLTVEDSFDEIKSKANSIWNKHLSAIRIKTDNKEIKEIFYSNFYHSLIKPCNRFGESFVYEGNNKPFYIDFATLWDMYKTALPLIFMLYPKESEEICESLILTGEKLGYLPNSIGLTSAFTEHNTQARMLGAYVLITAYRYGVKIDFDRMIKVIRNDVFSPDKSDFVIDGKCSSYTFFLDMADGCRIAADTALENGYKEIYNELIPLAKKWKDAYSEKTGLLKDDSEYYEGTLYNYSFRQMVDMDERIKLAGGKAKFVKLLDDFFGYGKPDVELPTNPFDYMSVEEGVKLGRFEGFNNESDTEAPYSYIYVGRQDRTCEIIRAGMKYMFTTGRGGIPGNNDSGALSSYYVLASLGLFPVAGQNLFLIGSPNIDSAEIDLFNGNKLVIDVKNNSDKNIYVESVLFNGKKLSDYKISAKELLSGGNLIFNMSERA